MATITATRRPGNSARGRIVEHLARRIEHIDRSHRPLLTAIAAAPEDDLPRLVYADWLEELGQTDRANFIRLQCRFAESGRPVYAPLVEQIIPDPLTEHLPPTSPVMLSARFVATHSPPGCPVRLRWFRGKMYRLTHGRYSPADKGDVRDDILRWLCDEVARIHTTEMQAWEWGGRRGRIPMRLKVTGRLVGQVFREVESHVSSMSWQTRRGDEASTLGTPPTDPDTWHFDLFGWDADLGVRRPDPISRVSRSLMIEPQPGTALPDRLRFDRGFVACGEFQWPRLWTIEEVAATCARQPVSTVRLHFADANAARRSGNRWVVRRGEPRGQWQRTRPEPWFADGVLPAAAFDVLADQSEWWTDRHQHELEYGSLVEAEVAVRRLEAEVNAAIQLALSGEMSPAQPMTP